ncbi:MAG TPA: iron ABC transporter permease, partial [Alphaproteobacteria bacterium]|nr:iron ABC transporter permease [Alphaproteobacteria bacterium]
MNRIVAAWTAVGWAGFLLLPWYATGFGPWLDGVASAGPGAPGLVQGAFGGRPWLLPLVLPLIVGVIVALRPAPASARGRLLIAAGALGLAYFAVQGLAIGLKPWSSGPGLAILGAAEIAQPAMGWGAIVVGLALLFLLTTGTAMSGAMRGDAFATGAVGFVVALVGTFIFFPLSRILGGALTDRAGSFDLGAAAGRLFSSPVWRLNCLFETSSCGVAWNSLFLAILTATSTTVLGLAFALVATRTGFRLKKPLRVLTLLPIITPPFVIGLAVLLLFGRSGTVTQFVAALFDIPPSRWVYGLPGIWFTQTLAFTPIAFMVLIGVVEGISPSVEEAAQTLRATRWKTFVTVSLPLMRPGIANAFLIGFIESLADFGNPLVMGGNYSVLSTEIFFSLVGASYDQTQAATLAVVLLFFTLGAFYVQRSWVGRKSYTTVTGKGDAGLPVGLPRPLTVVLYAITLPWAALTAVMYAMILFGGFVRLWGRDHSFTLEHYIEAFRIDSGVGGIIWSGAAWNSYWTTLQIAAISAPLTAAVGLLTAYLLVRQRFAGRDAFEFGTMLSFAIPGTVIGISYILAFNTPPIEITGTGLILVV